MDAGANERTRVERAPLKLQSIDQIACERNLTVLLPAERWNLSTVRALLRDDEYPSFFLFHVIRVHSFAFDFRSTKIFSRSGSLADDSPFS
jgi:hypothetical protein